MESDKNNQSNVEIQNQLHTTSNDGNIQPYNSSTLSHSQISLLQLQIRQFKQLTKQYSESKFSKWILENELGNNPNNNNANGNKLLSTTNSTTNSNSNIPSTTFNNPTTTSGAFSSIQNFGGINTQQTIPTPFINHNNNPGLTNISTQHYASGNPVPSLLPSMTPQIMQPQTLKPMSTLPPTITNISNVIREPVPPAMMLWRPLSAAVNCGPKMFSEGAIGTSQLVRIRFCFC